MKNQLFVNCATPHKLYRYSERKWAERALEFGEFLLKPASSFQNADPTRRDDELVRVRIREPKEIKIIRLKTGHEFHPPESVRFEAKSETDYLILCFSKAWDIRFFEKFLGADACLVIHNIPEFRKRIQQHVAKLLPEWLGVDIGVRYGEPHPLGVCFSKPYSHADENEWRFAWRPEFATPKVDSIKVTIGCIRDIADIRSNPDE